MSIDGWYYLHTNGDLIYKRELGGTAADIRESSFARALWPMDPSYREMAWNVLIESLSVGADLPRVEQLAIKWGCDDDDAEIYADVVGCQLFKDGNQWCATRKDFVNLQESPVGFGQTALEAMAALCKELGYKPAKMWGPTFEDLLKPSDLSRAGATSMKLERSYRDEDTWSEIPLPEARKHLGRYFGNVNGALSDMAHGDVLYAGDFKFRDADGSHVRGGR